MLGRLEPSARVGTVLCKDTLDGPLDVPLHPGAERYWREAGYL